METEEISYQERIREHQLKIKQVFTEVSKVVVGQQYMVNRLLIGLFTGGHILLEGVPGCSDCAFLPFCGADPVFHHATQGDMVGNKPTSAFCERNMAIIQHIFEILHTDPKRAKILRSWI